MYTPPTANGQPSCLVMAASRLLKNSSPASCFPPLPATNPEKAAVQHFAKKQVEPALFIY
jgi:hypothetical protein